MKDERLARYYLNGGDAFRLKLWIDDQAMIGIESTNENSSISVGGVEV